MLNIDIGASRDGQPNPLEYPIQHISFVPDRGKYLFCTVATFRGEPASA
jgi:hypothetical protein